MRGSSYSGKAPPPAAGASMKGLTNNKVIQHACRVNKCFIIKIFLFLRAITIGQLMCRVCFTKIFKKKEKNIMEEEFMGKDKDIDIDIMDVVIERKGFLPAISFSQKVHSQLVKPLESTVVVKLLGRSIGYKVLCNRLEALWNMSYDFSVIDLENNYFLVRFKRDSNAQHVLTQGPWIVFGHYLMVHS